jgi:predicted NodU family carbamoyl transferase
MSHDHEPIRISLVGHCTPDAFALRSAIAGFYPEAQVENINSNADFESRIGDFQLHLINRVLDGSFKDDSGISLIRHHASHHHALMLISNFPESLQEAVDAGGVQGFGKRDMRAESARIALQSAINLTQSS